MFAYFLLALAALALVLGFVALLRQKTYLDPNTKTPMEIEVPIFGRMKANVPALAFVFFAALFAFLAAQLSEKPGIEQWSLRGPVLFAGGTKISPNDWKGITVETDPPMYSRFVDSKKVGRVLLTLPLLSGITFEEAVTSILFELEIGERYFSCTYYPEQELEAWNDPETREQSIIRYVTKLTREIKAIKLGVATEDGFPLC